MPDPQPLSEAEEAELRKVIEGMTPGHWSVASDLPALAIMSQPSGYRVVQTENQNNFHHFGHSELWHGLERRDDAEGICDLRNAAPRMLATIANLRAAVSAAKRAHAAFRQYPRVRNDDHALDAEMDNLGTALAKVENASASGAEE